MEIIIDGQKLNGHGIIGVIARDNGCARLVCGDLSVTDFAYNLAIAEEAYREAGGTGDLLAQVRSRVGGQRRP